MVAQRALQAPQPMTAAQIAALSPTARAQYFSNLPPSQQAAKQAEVQQYINQMNRSYMKETVRKKAICPPASGSGKSLTYAVGSQLTFNAPVANNGFLEGFLVRINLQLDFAAGAGAVYAATASRELALIREIIVDYQGTQHKFKPYILRQLRRLNGILWPTWPDDVLGNGFEIQSLTDYLTQGTLPVSGSDQVIKSEYYVPLNLLHPQDIRGLLPIDGQSTTAQIILETAPAFLGNDSALNTWYAVSGSGHSITQDSGTVQVIAVYRDGTTMLGPASKPIQFEGVGTVQFQNDVTLTGLTADITYRQKITKLMPHYIGLLTVIDGQQATKYADIDNITYIDLVTDETGSKAFWKYGTGTDLSVYEYFNEIRWMLRQDLDEGIIPIVYAPISNEADPDNQNGSHILNCDPSRGGWSAVHYGVQLDSLASTLSGVTPRVESHFIWVNPQGLVAST